MLRQNLNLIIERIFLSNFTSNFSQFRRKMLKSFLIIGDRLHCNSLIMEIYSELGLRIIV